MVMGDDVITMVLENGTFTLLKILGFLYQNLLGISYPTHLGLLPLHPTRLGFLLLGFYTQRVWVSDTPNI